MQNSYLSNYKHMITPILYCDISRHKCGINSKLFHYDPMHCTKQAVQMSCSSWTREIFNYDHPIKGGHGCSLRFFNVLLQFLPKSKIKT